MRTSPSLGCSTGISLTIALASLPGFSTTAPLCVLGIEIAMKYRGRLRNCTSDDGAYISIGNCLGGGGGSDWAKRRCPAFLGSKSRDESDPLKGSSPFTPLTQ